MPLLGLIRTQPTYAHLHCFAPGLVGSEHLVQALITHSVPVSLVVAAANDVAGCVAGAQACAWHNTHCALSETAQEPPSERHLQASLQEAQLQKAAGGSKCAGRHAPCMLQHHSAVVSCSAAAAATASLTCNTQTVAQPLLT